MIGFYKPLIAFLFVAVVASAPGPTLASSPPSAVAQIQTESEENEGMPEIKMTITVGDQTLTATLIDNATTRSLVEMLPLTLPMMDLYSRELAYRFPEELPANEAQTSGYEVGDIGYWTPGHALVIFYAQNGEIISNLQKIGHVDSGVELLDGVGNVDVTFANVPPTAAPTPAPPAESSSERIDSMKIRIRLQDTVLTATLTDSQSTRDFISMLPLTLTLEDYSGTEKISDLPQKLSTEDVPPGSDPSVGDITYYAPWGNLAIFYKDFGYASGLVILGKIDGGMEALSGPASVEVTIELVSTEALSAKQRSIIPIAAFTANGDLEKLRTALNEGLDAGLTVNEIKEVLVHLYAYAGFPRSLNGINTFMAVLDERQAKGIEDEVGREASPVPSDMNKDEYGARVRATLAGWDEIPPPGGYQLFAPIIDTFLKEHLFADIFARDILDFPSRELVTVAALASMTGTGGQLPFHLGAAMNVGLTGAQMADFVSVLESKVGKQEAANAREVLDGVLSRRAR